jgi:hypothetical protein
MGESFIAHDYHSLHKEMDDFEGAENPREPASLYAALGKKEPLYRKALEREARGPAGYARKALEKPTVRDVVEALLEGAVAVLTKPQNPGGCLLVQGPLACGKKQHQRS